ncbi:MAG: hypothetical protein HUU20_24100 [Pirellulales bacterium]|nr:hypothetical protein [Pirellulales bacterium]
MISLPPVLPPICAFRSTPILPLLLLPAIAARLGAAEPASIPVGNNPAPYPRLAKSESGARSALLKQGYAIANMDGTLRRLIAIDNVCAWPNFTRLRAGLQPHLDRESKTIPATAAHSADAAQSWDPTGSVPPGDEGLSNLVAFGDICLTQNGDLATAMSTCESNKDCCGRRGTRACALPLTGRINFVRSKDDGQSWTGKTFLVGAIHGEAAIVHLGSGQWLTAWRCYGFLDLDIHGSDGGRVMTVFHAKGVLAHRRYHAGILSIRLDEIRN